MQVVQSVRLCVECVRGKGIGSGVTAKGDNAEKVRERERERERERGDIYKVRTGKTHSVSTLEVGTSVTRKNRQTSIKVAQK